MPPSRRLGLVVPLAMTLATPWFVARSTASNPEEDPERPPARLLADSPILNPTGVALASIVEVGQVLPTTPDLGSVDLGPPATLDRVRQHLEAGDPRRALLAAQAYVDADHHGRDRNAALMVVGMLHREAGRHNLASEAFTRIRSNGGPLEPWGAFYEAEQDLARGRHGVAIAECEKIREKWPEGHHANACLRIMARAWAAQGKQISARSTADAYDEDNEFGQIRESIDLQLALWAREHDRPAALEQARVLAVHHDNPLTGRIAEEILAEAISSDPGIPGVPDDVESLKSRAISLRDAKRRDAAWALFEELGRRAEDDAELAAWVEGEAERFGWRTHRWDELVDLYRARYEEEKKGEDAWELYRALDRGGRQPEAGAFALQAMKDHGNTKEWRRQEEIVARTLLLARDYPHARELYDTVARRGGWTGRRAEFFAAFSSLMAGELEEAVKRFTRIADSGSSHQPEARYWRARAYDALERAELARADRAWLAENDAGGWYALLVSQEAGDVPAARPYRRDGAWAGAPLPEPLPAEAPDATLIVTTTPPIAAPTAPSPRAPAPGFGLLSWPAGGFLSPLQPELAPTLVERNDELDAPRDYQAGPLYDEVATREQLDRLAERHGGVWPELPAIYDLARAGLHDLSGPLMAEWFESWREAYRNPGDRHHGEARKLIVTGSEWRQIFYYVRDHHHASRFTFGLWDDLDDPALDLAATRLAYPLAHDSAVWTASREHDVDPYLVLGLMRAESTYNAVAVSRVGARGAMQIMPRTGHLLADLAHDVSFTSADLEDPDVSVAYGIRYLGLLMDRFEGVYPLAVASYNGGPFNVSEWLAGTGTEMPMDAIVEHIPFRETRDYVKKVCANYALYTGLYAPAGSRVALPPTARGDHAEIVDF